jgi:hypothetical protein
MEPVKKILPAYPFVQYSDDPDVVAFFLAYNEMAQEYLTGFNNLALPCWTSPYITGALLDWIARGIYGEERPQLQVSEASVAKGTYNSIEYNAVQYAGLKNYRPGSSLYLPDDYFKRILTWNFYKGDGFQFSTDWLKRRVARFIHGKDGIDPPLQHTFDISITSASGIFSINIPEYGDGVATLLKAAIEQELVHLPFIYQYSVTVTEQ